jgi:hypothetical protein
MNGSPDAIVKGEREHRLDQVSVFGVPLWRLIREQVVDAHLSSGQGRSRSNQNRVPANRIPHVIGGVLRSLAHLSRLKRREFLVIGFPRRRLDNREWIDHFSDPIIDLLGPDRVLCLEKSFVGEHCRPPKTRGIVYYDWVTGLNLVASSLFFVIPWIVYGREISELASRASRVVDTSPRRIRVLAARALVRFRIERAVSRLLLAVVRPRVVLLTLRRHHYAFISMCKARGIPVYELQHGTVAEHGYKSRKIYHSWLDPDVFLAFGEYWKTADWGLPAETVRTIGFKYICDRKAELARGPPARGRKVMLVSQPHLAGGLGTAFGTIVRTYSDVQFLLKLHPQDVDRWWQRYPFGQEPNVQVLTDRGLDLYSLFTECSAVIGFDSTVLFEASFFGLKVGILNFDGRNRCAALQFVGRFNFHEIRDSKQVADLLRTPPSPGESGDNPFFAKFDESGFLGLMEQGMPSPQMAAGR